MPDTLIIGGQTYTNVAGIKATDINDVIQTFSKGGGGASNLVTGTFKGTTTGAAMDVNIPYTGTGYPIAVIVYPTEGPYNSSGTFYNTVQRYALITWFSIKNVLAPPEYSTDDTATRFYGYKSSATTASSFSYSVTATNNAIYRKSDAASSNIQLRINSSTKMSVFIASNSYGFAANVEYTYHIIYSS